MSPTLSWFFTLKKQVWKDQCYWYVEDNNLLLSATEVPQYEDDSLPVDREVIFSHLWTD